MKKILSLALILCLLLAALPLGASAYSVVLSPQNLEVDGVLYDCEKYNIDGSNYFKLRDLAVLLSGTPAEFAVSWDAAANAVVLAPGLPYVPDGSELLIGEDKSAFAVPSAQTIWFLDAPADDLSVYNIGGNNFFKLRDLGELMGFTVDYDAGTNTAIVRSGAPLPAPAPGQAAAFDTLRAWVDQNYDEALGEDKACLLWHDEWEDGDHDDYYLVNTTLDGEPVLLLLRFYTFADGDEEDVWLFLERDATEFYGALDYTFSGEDEPDFTGELFLSPASFDASVPVTFLNKNKEVESAELETLTGNATFGFSWLLRLLGDYCAEHPSLYGLSAASFGFNPAKLTTD